MEIPRGNCRDGNKARKQIIKDFYASWIADHPDKKIWNNALRADIYVKFKSINETAGQASKSYESTLEVIHLSEILANASLIKVMPPKRGDSNQKPYSKMLIMKYKKAMLVVGFQRSTGEYVQYCISRR